MKQVGWTDLKYCSGKSYKVYHIKLKLYSSNWCWQSSGGAGDAFCNHIPFGKYYNFVLRDISRGITFHVRIIMETICFHSLLQLYHYCQKTVNIYSALFPAEHCTVILPKPTYDLVGLLDIQFTYNGLVSQVIKS